MAKLGKVGEVRILIGVGISSRRVKGVEVGDSGGHIFVSLWLFTLVNIQNFAAIKGINAPFDCYYAFLRNPLRSFPLPKIGYLLPLFYPRPL